MFKHYIYTFNTPLYLQTTTPPVCDRFFIYFIKEKGEAFRHRPLSGRKESGNTLLLESEKEKKERDLGEGKQITTRR